MLVASRKTASETDVPGDVDESRRIFLLSLPRREALAFPVSALTWVCSAATYSRRREGAREHGSGHGMESEGPGGGGE